MNLQDYEHHMRGRRWRDKKLTRPVVPATNSITVPVLASFLLGMAAGVGLAALLMIS